MNINSAMRDSNPEPTSSRKNLHVVRPGTQGADKVQAYQGRDLFGLGLTDVSWMGDLEATFERMKHESPSYPASFYKLHVVEKIAYALCLDHPRVEECLNLLLAQDNPPALLHEISNVARQIQKQKAPDSFSWLSPVDAQGAMRPLNRLLALGVLTEHQILDRAFAMTDAPAVVVATIDAVTPASAARMRQVLTRKLLMAGTDDAVRIRRMLGLSAYMSSWEASQRFHLMFELAAPDLLDENHQQPQFLSPDPSAGIAVQMQMLSADRGYLNDLAQQDLVKVIHRLMLQTTLYAAVDGISQITVNEALMGAVIDFCNLHVRGARDLMINALLSDCAQGALYCPAPWEMSAADKLARFLHNTGNNLTRESRFIQVKHQLGKMVLASS